MAKTKTATITDVNSEFAQRLFRGFAAKIREILMADAAKQFKKVARQARTMKHGEAREFVTKPLIVRVSKREASKGRMNIRILCFQKRTQ